MYTYIKKALLVLSLLAIPCMNAGVMAMQEELEYNETSSLQHGYQLMEKEQEPVTQSTYSSTLKLSAYKGLLIGTFILACFISPAEAAGPCYCTCAGSPNVQKCGYMGILADNASCYNYCMANGFLGKYICINAK